MKTLTAIALALAISQVGCAFAKPKVKTTNKYEPKMKFIKGGHVIININKPANLKNNKVKVKSFWIAETETSFKQWQNCFKEGGCKKEKDLPGYSDPRSRLIYSNRPVVYVSWYEANEYTRWLSKISGKKYRLPTDAEWEYAARAGKKTLYPWGNRLIGIEKCKVCNYNSGAFLAPVDYNNPEDGFAPYGGLYYMYGNAAEWTCSPFVDKQKYKFPTGKENICLTPATYSSGDMKTKGGSYELHFNSEAYEHWPDGQLDGARPPAKNFNWIGFRVIREE